jgi:hypothetical protein
MALLVGIDEAGYGPHLGPLVVAAATLELPAAADADPFISPDLWGHLADHIHNRPAGARARAVICDSKVAYSSGNLATLERTVLGALAAGGVRPDSFATLLQTLVVSTEAGRDGATEPWHRPETMALPRAAAPEEIEGAAAAIAQGLAGIGGRVVGLRVSLASPSRLNRLMDDRNKAGALFALAADLLAEALARSTDGAIHITMDRHGGRRYYGDVLSGAFPMIQVRPVEEKSEISRYLLHRNGSAAALTVREKCESWSLPTALASMTAKYVRELAMLELNAYFQERVPGLRATAGYGLDAWRFLNDVAAARTAAGVPDALILRNR